MLVLDATAAAMLAFGLSLLAAGLRGRRTDDHPLCRRCAYDLTGRVATAAACSECGADLSRRRAVRVGHRVRRRRLLAGGAVLVVPAVATLCVVGWVRARGIDPTPYKPVLWLRHDLDGGPALEAKALAELTARVTAGRLSTGQAGAVADRALLAQASAAPWDPAWGTFIEAAHAAGRLDRSRWAAYGRQAVRLSLHVGRSYPLDGGGTAASVDCVRQGDLFEVESRQGPIRLSSAAFRAVFYLDGFAIDGHSVPQATAWREVPIQSDGREGSLDVCRVGAGLTSPRRFVDADVSRRLAGGPHAMSETGRVLLYDAADLPDYGVNLRTLPDASKLLATFDVAITGTAAIVVRPVERTDPARRAAVTAAMRDVSVIVGRRSLGVIHVRVVDSPERVAFRVSVRPIDGYRQGEMSLGPMDDVVACSPGKTGTYDLKCSDAIDDEVTRVDVIFRPDVGAVPADNPDPAPIWGEPIVVHDVPITRPLARRPTLKNDPAQRAAIAAAIRDVTVVADRHFTFTVRGQIVNPPERVVYRTRIKLVDGSGDAVDLPGVVVCSPGSDTPFELRVRVHDDDATRVDVTFRPDPAAAPSDREDATPIWGEPVVVHGLPITREE